MKNLLLINAERQARDIDEAAAGLQPHRDYNSLAERLQAEIIDLTAGQTAAGQRWWRRFIPARYAQKLGQVGLAYRQRYAVGVILADSELYGLGLAVLFWLEYLLGRRRAGRARLIFIGHYLTPLKKQFWLRLPKLAAQIHCILCHASAQRDFLLNRLKLSPEKVALVPYLVDTKFWHTTQPISASPDERPLIISFGWERRDYATFVQAVKGLPVRVAVSGKGYAPGQSWPAEFIQREFWAYPELRQLYQEAALVVVPLQKADFQAGITAILEGMAMGKPIILTHVSGQTDVVTDPRTPNVGLAAEFAQTQPELVGMPTGRYVPSGDAPALSRAITDLLGQPDELQQLGQNARTIASQLFTLENFVEQIYHICRK